MLKLKWNWNEIEMKLSKECCIVFTYLANFWWWLFTPLTDTVSLSCCGPPCGREQVLLITAWVAGGFFGEFFLTWFPRSKQKTMKEGARGEGSEKNRLQSTPWDFWNCVRFLDAGSGSPDWPTEFQPVSWCQIPSGYKLQKSTVGWNEAYLIYVRSKK